MLFSSDVLHANNDKLTSLTPMILSPLIFMSRNKIAAFLMEVIYPGSWLIKITYLNFCVCTAFFTGARTENMQILYLPVVPVVRFKFATKNSKWQLGLVTVCILYIISYLQNATKLLHHCAYGMLGSEPPL